MRLRSGADEGLDVESELDVPGGPGHRLGVDRPPGDGSSSSTGLEGAQVARAVETSPRPGRPSPPPTEVTLAVEAVEGVGVGELVCGEPAGRRASLVAAHAPGAPATCSPARRGSGRLGRGPARMGLGGEAKELSPTMPCTSAATRCRPHGARVPPRRSDPRPAGRTPSPLPARRRPGPRHRSPRRWSDQRSRRVTSTRPRPRQRPPWTARGPKWLRTRPPSRTADTRTSPASRGLCHPSQPLRVPDVEHHVEPELRLAGAHRRLELRREPLGNEADQPDDARSRTAAALGATIPQSPSAPPRGSAHHDATPLVTGGRPPRASDLGSRRCSHGASPLGSQRGTLQPRWS